MTDFGDGTIEIPGMGTASIVILTCCKDWPIIMGLPWGNCGDCGERPRKRD